MGLTAPVLTRLKAASSRGVTAAWTPTSYNHIISQQQKQPISATATANMPTYIITCKEDASDDQVAAVKQQAKDQGGTIEHEYNIIKGFSVKFPEGHVTTLENHEHVKAVEADGLMHTQ